MARLGELEQAVMEVLWARPSGATVRDVVRALTERELAYTTLMTVLDRLMRKGFARRELDGRAWRYWPTKARDLYVADLMLGALELTGDRGAALTHFAASMPPDDAAALRRALRGGSAKK